MTADTTRETVLISTDREGKEVIFVFPYGVKDFCAESKLKLLSVSDGSLWGWDGVSSDWMEIPSDLAPTAPPQSTSRKKN